MGTVIEGVSVVRAGWRGRHSALRLATGALRRALVATGREASEIDLLVNAGLYRDRNLGEPALAPLIQEDVGANPQDPEWGRHGTFSFDVANGACGVLTALEICDGFLRTGTSRLAAVVASDANPGRRMAPGFPYEPAGAAVLCVEGGEGRGLGVFRWVTGGDGGASFHSTVGMADGRQTLVITESATFADEAAIVAAKAAAEALADAGVEPGEVDLVVASPGAPSFGAGLSAALTIPLDRFVLGPAGLHTAALLAGFARAHEQEALRPAAKVLLVGAGGGITAGAAVYLP